MFQEHKWVDGSALSYQEFDNYHFAEKYSAKTILHYSRTVGTRILSAVEGEAVKVLHPKLVAHDMCTIILMSNLALPEWMSIKCHSELFGNIYCSVLRIQHGTININETHTETFCGGFSFHQSKKCFLISWVNEVKKEYALHKGRGGIADGDVLAFKMLLTATSGKISPLVYLSTDSIHVITFEKYLNKFEHKIQHIPFKVDGFEATSQKHLTHLKGDNIFLCSEGNYLSQIYVCCKKINCSLDRKTKQAECTNTSLLTKTNSQKSFQSKFCSFLYFLDRKGHCSKFESASPKFSEQTLFTHINKKNISCTCHVLMNDLLADCGLQGEDEPILISFLSSGLKVECAVGEIPCLTGHPKCYNITDICSFRLDYLSHLMPCRNGDHLENCKHFECNTLFKCPESYCVPWSYVCNGKWDCPHDSDEFSICTEERRCAEKLKCTNMQFLCIHVNSICNHIHDCPFGDDEELCELNMVQGPKRCECLRLALFCSQTTINFTKNYPYMSVALQSLSLDPHSTFSFLKKSIILQLIDTNLTTVCHILQSNEMRWLTVNHNYLVTLDENCFEGLYKIIGIQIDANCISSITQKAFHAQLVLQRLNLSSNPIIDLPPDIFPSSVHLTIISLRNNSFTTVHENIFSNILVDFIHTDDYHICCLKPIDTACGLSSLGIFPAQTCCQEN